MKASLHILTFLLITTGYSQTVWDNVIGQIYTFEIEELSAPIEVQVYTPRNNESKDVLVIFDGQRLFGHGVSISQTFQQFKLSPELVIVGINTPYPQRFGYFTRDTKTLLSFIDKDLLPFISEKYSTSEHRILFGWEYAGSMVFQALIDNPNLFDTYIAASPFPIDSKLEELDSLLKNPMVKSSLYYTVEGEEGMVVEGTDRAKKLLESIDHQNFSWKYQVLENEEHRSTSYATLYHGLRDFYRYYPEIQFNTLSEFDERGGLNFVYEYYKERANLYGFPSAPTPWTMFSITRIAIRANDYSRFDAFVQEFESSDFLSNIRLSRAISVADFYLQNENSTKAIEIYKFLSEKDSTSTEPLIGLSKAYKKVGNIKKSKEYFDLANQLKN